jgi:hypothetical protein
VRGDATWQGRRLSLHPAWTSKWSQLARRRDLGGGASIVGELRSQRAGRMGLPPRLARAAFRCACSEAASCACSGPPAHDRAVVAGTSCLNTARDQPLRTAVSRAKSASERGGAEVPNPQNGSGPALVSHPSLSAQSLVTVIDRRATGALLKRQSRRGRVRRP